MSRVLRNADQRLGFEATSTGGSADQSTTSCGLEGISKSQTLRTGIGLREDSAMRHPIWSHVPLSRSPLSVGAEGAGLHPDLISDETGRFRLSPGSPAFTLTSDV